MVPQSSSTGALSRQARRAVTDAAEERAAAMVEAFAASSPGPGDPQRRLLREQAITAWTPLAYRLARRYASRPGTEEDLQQVAVIGLIKAVDRYEADRDVDFTAYAIPTIVGELKRYFRDRGWALHVPRRMHDLYLAITEGNTRLVQRLGPRPTVTDMCHDM